MVTPSGVVRVNRWLALPTVSVAPMAPAAPAAAGIIGHARTPEPAEDGLVPPSLPPAPEAKSPRGGVEAPPARGGGPDCVSRDGDGVVVDENATDPPAMAATATIAVPAAASSRRGCGPPRLRFPAIPPSRAGIRWSRSVPTSSPTVGRSWPPRSGRLAPLMPICHHLRHQNLWLRSPREVGR